MAWVVIMDCEDGSLHVNSGETLDESIDYRMDCMNDGGYKTTEPFQMPDETDWNSYEKEIQGASFKFEFPE